MKPEQIEKLRELAEKATPGKRRHDAIGERSGFERVYTGADDGPGQTIAQWVLPVDAALIATLDPTTVLALLSELSKLRAVAEAAEVLNRAITAKYEHAASNPHQFAKRDADVLALRTKLRLALSALAAREEQG